MANAQSLIPNLSQFINTPVYYNAPAKEVGVVLLTKIDSFKRVGLDLDALIGLASSSSKFSDFAGVAGIALTGQWTYPKTPYFLKAGVTVTWDSGHHTGSGPVIMLGKKF